jgi:hypothetical protein
MANFQEYFFQSSDSNTVRVDAELFLVLV